VVPNNSFEENADFTLQAFPFDIADSHNFLYFPEAVVEEENNLLVEIAKLSF